jgi:hypothetical protein
MHCERIWPSSALSLRKDAKGIWHDADLMNDTAIAKLDAESERREGSIAKCRDHFVAVDEVRIFASAHRRLQCDVEVRDLQLMLDERTAGLAIFAAPFEVGEGGAVALQQTCTAIRESIGDWGEPAVG